MREMPRCYLQDAPLRLKPRQLKRQRLCELLEWDQPQPELRPEPVHYKPLGWAPWHAGSRVRRTSCQARRQR